MASADSDNSTRQHAVLAVVALVVFTVVWLGLFWVMGGFGAGTQGKPYTHLHCPECGLEMTYTSVNEGKPCPQCGGAGPKLEPTVGSYKNRENRGKVGATGKMLVAGLVAGVLDLGLLFGWVHYQRARRRAEEEARNQPVVCNCPFCSRKIGYHASRAGAGAVCPRCKTAFVLPEGEALEL